ncbi:Hpt domain-containing protein [Aquibium microcysteis]|uniref:Hpt domain-containing protein n=1 Tax=Aquibium microcysteis TaxID=675281 RepID=UPI00165D1456|nr:Hpt domain-containing protein [Aquibium microcysteis]
MSVENMAFAMPGGETCGHSRARPVDLAHLSRQTMGDRDLEREVLSLFLHQAQVVGDRLEGATVQERVLLAHGLKGSARGIGAFRVADIADRLESEPASGSHVRSLAEAIVDVRDFVSAISR